MQVQVCSLYTCVHMFTKQIQCMCSAEALQRFKLDNVLEIFDGIIFVAAPGKN